MQIRNMQSLNSGSSSKRSPLLIQQPSGRTPQRKKVTFKLPNKGPSDSIADSFDEFKPTDEAFAPEVGNGKNIPSYRKPSSRPSGLGIGSNGNIFQGNTVLAPGSSSVVDLNYDDTLRRVSVVVQQHVVRGERHKRRDANKRKKQVEEEEKKKRNSTIKGNSYGPFRGMATQEETSVLLETPVSNISNGVVTSNPMVEDTAGDADMARQFAIQATADFNELFYATPRWKYSFVNVPNSFMMTYGLKKMDRVFKVPSSEKIYQFLKHIFVRCQLSAECSVVCLIYVERLMETAGIDLLSNNWRPVMLCGLLLASKVWQDLNCWNVEFASVLPDFPLKSINQLERTFLKYLRYSLFISGSVYAKYYFALRSLGEKKNFRNKYNTVVMTSSRQMIPSSHQKATVERRSEAIKSEFYSRSM